MAKAEDHIPADGHLRTTGREPLALSACVAAVFDLDGVVTDTARVHAAAWKELFDDVLVEVGRGGPSPRPFDDRDYLRHVDGKARVDGIRDFLASRGIVLPDQEVEELGRRKDIAFRARLRHEGVQAFPDAIALVGSLRRSGRAVAVASASRNCKAVLEGARLAQAFDVRVDGIDAEVLALPGKPDPALFHEAARRLGAPPARAALFEDAAAGVQAGHHGGFGLVVGVQRRPGAHLAEAGADVVVGDLWALVSAIDEDRRQGGSPC
jgi:beta-phosphoglucomutase family hydrolase